MRATTSLTFGLLLLVGCGAGRYKYEPLGHRAALVTSTASVDQPPPDVAGAGVSVQAGDTVVLAWTVQQPQAEQLGVRFTCPNDDGEVMSIGESFAAYKERRLTTLRAARDQRRADREQAIAERAKHPARATVATPLGNVAVTVEVAASGYGTAEAAADAALDAGLLPPGDVGGGELRGTRTVRAQAAGSCTMVVYADTPGVTGHVTAQRQRDLEAEASADLAVRQAAAIGARASLTASLVAAGADPDAAARRAQAARQLAYNRETNAGADADAARARYVAYLISVCGGNPRAREQAAARIELAARRDDAVRAHQVQLAFELRTGLTALLIGQGADPDRRAHLEAAAQVDAQAVQLQAQAAIDARAAAHASWLTAALDVRVRMLDALVAQGARLRPSMPAPVDEYPGDLPMPGMVWMAGAWTWTGVQWDWVAGGWIDGRGSYTVERPVGGAVVVTGGGGASSSSASTSSSVDISGAVDTAATVLGSVLSGSVTVTPPAPPTQPAGTIVVHDRRTK